MGKRVRDGERGGGREREKEEGKKGGSQTEGEKRSRL